MSATRKPRAPRTWAYRLWKLMHDEHGLLLLESELQEIVDVVLAMGPDERPKPPTFKQKVLQVHPGAWLQDNRASTPDCRFTVWGNRKWNARPLGSGATQNQAWANAEKGI